LATAKFYAFEVKRFRSLLDLKLEVDESLPIVICGENNIGKTNFLRALNIFFNHPFSEVIYDPKIDIPHHIYEGSRGANSNTELIGYFKDDKSQFRLNVKFKDNGDIEYKLKNKSANFEEVKEFLINYHYIFIESHNIHIPSLISAALEKDGLLPLDSKRKKQSEPLKKLDEFIQLSIEAIVDIEKKINENFKKLTDFDGILKNKSVRINFAEFDKLRDVIKTMTSITLDDGNNHGMASKGSGAQRAVFISLMQYISQNSKRDVIWGIDEPEAFLQPRLQKKVFDVFNEIVAIRNQSVILTTHSQHFIKLNCLKTTYIFKGEISERKYKRKPNEVFYEINTKPIDCSSDFEKATHIKEHLGISNNDGWELLPFNILVEGEEDKKYLETLFGIVGLASPNIIWSGGASKIGGYLQYYENFAKDLPYKPEIICIFDNDFEGREQSKKIDPKKLKHINATIVELIRFDGKKPNQLSQEDWEIEDFVPFEGFFDAINTLLTKEKYKKISSKQIRERVNTAHLTKQILKYAEECSQHNNPGKTSLQIDNEGRKKQLCKLYCEMAMAGKLSVNLSNTQHDFLKSLVKL
jgi:predicted ATPase